jgi:hypothetical protein
MEFNLQSSDEKRKKLHNKKFWRKSAFPCHAKIFLKNIPKTSATHLVRKFSLEIFLSRLDAAASASHIAMKSE